MKDTELCIYYLNFLACANYTLCALRELNYLCRKNWKLSISNSLYQ